MVPTTFKPKTFWEKPEGMTGLLGIAAAVLGGGFVLFKGLPFIITLLENTLYTLFLLGVIVGVGFILINPQTRNLLIYGYRSICRLITSVFVTIDPIGIVRNYIDTLRKNMKRVKEQIMKLRGQIEYLDNLIRDNDRQMNENLKKVKVAQESKEQRYVLTAKLSARKAGRLEQSTMSYKDMRIKLETLYRTLSKIEELGNFMVEDLSDEVEQKIRERNAIRTSHSALKSAMKIIKPDQDQRYLFDMAMEAMAEDVASKVGDIQYLVETSQSFMDGMDLQNGIFEKDGLDLLEKWEKSDSPVLGPRKQILLQQARSDEYPLDLDRPVEAETPPRERYGQFFNGTNKEMP